MQDDFAIQYEGSIILLHPRSSEAREWVQDHIGPDNGFQPYWPTVVIEPRYAGDIVAGIQADGLKI